MKDPPDRYQSVADIRRDLEDAGSRVSETAPLERSIAVLPFTNLSGDPQNQYFGDGLAEDLINALIPIRWLHAGRSRLRSVACSEQVKPSRSL